MLRETVGICLQALCVIMVSACLALAVNAMRSEGLPLVMPFPPEYQCPSVAQEGNPVKAEQALKMLGRKEAVFVDARSREVFQKGHIEGAINIPYSLVKPISKEDMDRLKRFRTIIIYCNAKDSEKSKLMAGELSQAGLEAAYLEEGLLGWVRAGGKHEGQPPDHYE